MGIVQVTATVRNPAVGATICFGPAGVEPILGLTALESVGIEVDPVSQRLKCRPAVRMKRRFAAAVVPASL